MVARDPAPPGAPRRSGPGASPIPERGAPCIGCAPLCYDAFMRWESLREYRSRAGHVHRRGDSGWTPAADVSETDDCYIVVAELPGVRRADVDVAATQDSLTIRGFRPDPGCAPAGYVRLERGHGPFVRRFSFADRLAVDGVQADFKDGILTITLPKAVESRGRRVEVG